MTRDTVAVETRAALATSPWVAGLLGRFQIIKNGRNPTLRHVNRTHRVNADWLTEVFRNEKQIKLVYCKTVDMAADIFTKAFHNVVKWLPALSNINMIDTSLLDVTKASNVKNPVKQ